MTPEDAAAKADYIAAFFDDLRARVAFTQELADADHRNEALLLCTCYIDGLGQWLHPKNPGSAATFVRMLRDHGGEPSLMAILPRRLGDKLPKKGSNAGHAAKTGAFLSKLPQKVALSEAALLAAATPVLTPQERALLKTHSWRGTVGSVAYELVRSMNVHMLGSPGAITFSETTFQGSPLPDIDYPLLKRALDRVLTHAQVLSLSSNRWFGHM